MDNATENGERIVIARCFVEISASKNLPNQVTLELEDGELVSIPVEYEWIPPCCKNCINFGHIEAQCPTIKVWKPKENIDSFMDKPVTQVEQDNASAD